MSKDLRTAYKAEILAVKDLPTLPDMLDEVTRVMDQPESTGEQVAAVIARDQVLSAKILRMVNSPIYGFPGRIGSIHHALVLLGFNVVRGLIISTSVFEVMVQHMRGLWEHSVACSTASDALARHLNLKEPEVYMVAGLLHDLGKVVTAVQLPEAHERILEQVRRDGLLYMEAEKNLLGVHHGQINSWLADHWNLPAVLKEGLGYHHKPQLARHYPLVSAVVHVADFLAYVFGLGDGVQSSVPYLRPEALETLGLNPKSLPGVLDAVSERLSSVRQLSMEV